MVVTDDKRAAAQQKLKAKALTHNSGRNRPDANWIDKDFANYRNMIGGLLLLSY